MQAIVTTFLGPTNFRGARIKATCQAGSITVPFEYAPAGNDHDLAAIALIVKLGWNDGRGQWIGGGLPDGRGNCYVCHYSKIKGTALKLPRKQASK